ncbi:Uncharacterised protein [uncultured archaeon]|nr:Uncharacterised protein [uncultured archaeon]
MKIGDYILYNGNDVYAGGLFSPRKYVGIFRGFKDAINSMQLCEEDRREPFIFVEWLNYKSNFPPSQQYYRRTYFQKISKKKAMMYLLME